MEIKENETITLEEFIKIVANQRRCRPHTAYITMTKEFFNHLQLQSSNIPTDNPSTILGLKIIKLANGKCEWHNGKKVDWDIIDPTIKWQ